MGGVVSIVSLNRISARFPWVSFRFGRDAMASFLNWTARSLPNRFSLVFFCFSVVLAGFSMSSFEQKFAEVAQVLSIGLMGVG